MTASTLPAPTSIDDLPEWDGRWRGHVTSPMTRRRFASRAIVAGAIGVGVSVLNALGGRAPAAMAQSCTTTGLTYLNNCGGSNYSTTCSDGCPRSPGTDSSWFCSTSSFRSRHRACSEPRYDSGSQLTYGFAIRPNQCYTSTADGWIWEGVDSGGTCGCVNVRQFSCNDGYYRVESPYLGGWNPSICQTARCL